MESVKPDKDLIVDVTSTEVHGLAGDDGILHHLGELLDNTLNLNFLNAGLFGNLIDDFCLSHS